MSHYVNVNNAEDNYAEFNNSMFQTNKNKNNTTSQQNIKTSSSSPSQKKSKKGISSLFNRFKLRRTKKQSRKQETLNNQPQTQSNNNKEIVKKMIRTLIPENIDTFLLNQKDGKHLSMLYKSLSNKDKCFIIKTCFQTNNVKSNNNKTPIYNILANKYKKNLLKVENCDTSMAPSIPHPQENFNIVQSRYGNGMTETSF